MQGNLYLSDLRINRIVRKLSEELELAKGLTYLNRVPTNDVFDNRDILATYSAQIYAADIIMNDAEARVVKSGNIVTEAKANVIPNIKIGKALTQTQLEQLTYLERGLAGAQGGDLKKQITQQELLMAREVVQGVRETQNLLCAGMFLDGVTYSRNGVQIAPGFGTPSNLKATNVSNRTWTSGHLATMDAITDIQQLALTARIEYGKTYDRVDMATTMFQLIIQSDAFKNQIRTFRGLESTDSVDISIYNISQAQTLFEAISGFKLVLEDKNIVVENNDGTPSSNRVLPENKVILSYSGDDNNDTVYDLAMGIPEELTVGRLTGVGANLETVQSGITSYYEGGLNPPRITAWAVVKCFPRKRDVYSTAILTVY